MIRVEERPLPAEAERGLQAWQAEIDGVVDFARRVETGKQRFSGKNRRDNAVFAVVRQVLAEMCRGVVRCMYCEDSLADEIEHHKPKHFFPSQVFQWKNYLFSCGPCNGTKRNQFSVFTDSGEMIVDGELVGRLAEPVGDSVLLNPRVDDPLEFMKLDLVGHTYNFFPTADDGTVSRRRAEYTIEILRSKRRDIGPATRRKAYEGYRARLTEYIFHRDRGGDAVHLDQLKKALLGESHPTVWHEMLRQQKDIPELKALFDQAREALEWR